MSGSPPRNLARGDRLRLAAGRQTGGAQRVGMGPGSGGVDHRTSQQLVLLAVAAPYAQQERLNLTARAADLVHAPPRDPYHPVSEPDVRGHVRQRGQRT